MHATTIRVSSDQVAYGGVVNHSVDVSSFGEINQINVIPQFGDGRYSLGHLVLEND